MSAQMPRKAALQLSFLVILCYLSLTECAVPCVTPQNEVSECMSVYECRQFVRLLDNITAQNIQLMRASKCGTGPAPHYDPLVCCPPIAKSRLAVTQSFPKLRALSENCGVSDSEDKVIGGSEAQLTQFPWMVLLRYKKNNDFHCGGFLISNRHILTAAHCLVGKVQEAFGDVISVRVGEHDLRTDPDERPNQGQNEPHQDIGIKSMHVHSGYMLNGNQLYKKYHDIALIQLTRDITFSDSRYPICLPINGEAAKPTDPMFVAGWGIEDLNILKMSDIKRYVSVKLFDQATCKKIYGVIDKYQMCAGGEEGKDACVGDSGGPLMNLLPDSTNWYAEGIVSWGPKVCGTAGAPGIYVRVSEYLPWIEQHLD